METRLLTDHHSPLQGNHVFIFGGSTGIGLATARAALARGAKVTIAGRSLEKLQAAAAQWPQLDTVVADISSRKSVEAALAGRQTIHHLVITAGQRIVGKLASSDPDDLLQAIQERICGPVYAIRAALPVLAADASIVLTSGVLAHRPTAAGTAVIAAACGGVEALVGGLALELQPMRVNAIAPGFTETGLLDSLGAEAKAAIMQRARDASPVKKIGSVEEVASAVMFLLTNGYVSGEILRIDGASRLV